MQHAFDAALSTFNFAEMMQMHWKKTAFTSSCARMESVLAGCWLAASLLEWLLIWYRQASLESCERANQKLMMHYIIATCNHTEVKYANLTCFWLRLGLRPSRVGLAIGDGPRMVVTPSGMLDLKLACFVFACSTLLSAAGRRE